MTKEQYPYSINIADLGLLGSAFASILLSGIVPRRLQRFIDKSRVDEQALVLECPDDQAKAIIEVIRMKFSKWKVRCYKGKVRI